MPWEATRPSSFLTAYATVVGCGNSFDVQSAAPDTTTVMSFTTQSVIGNDRLVWKAWGASGFVPDANFVFGIRISCKSMGTSYLVFEYSVDAGGNWNSLISSVGGSNLGATTITRSLAATLNPSSVWIRANQVNGHNRGRAQLWDVFLVGSYTDPSSFPRAPGETMGISDAVAYTVQGATAYGANPAEAAGVSDAAWRGLTMVRPIES